MNRLVVEKNAVRIFAMLSEGFAVVGHDGDDGVVVESAGAQLPEELPYCRIDVCDLAVVESVGVPGFIGLRRIVGMVGIVKMHPDKKWSLGMSGQPGKRVGRDIGASALSGGVAIFAGMARGETGIVSVESAIEAGGEFCGGIEDDCADEGGGAISVGTKNLRRVGQVGRQRYLKI